MATTLGLNGETNMDDSRYGSANKRGDWKPKDSLTFPPMFVWPVKPLAFMTWLVKWDGYLFPWNFLFAILSLAVWRYATPPLETIAAGGWLWMGLVLFRNLILAIVFYGAWHLWFYARKVQGTRFKFNGSWPSTGDVFLFKRQTVDNVIWTLLSGVPIWSAYECLMLWLFATHRIPYVEYFAHPVYVIAVFFAIPIFHSLHFYLIHRALHWPPLYRSVHSLHHNYVNPGPWSGLSMHPIEHLAYFSGVLIHVIVPSHPAHAVFHLLHSALGPARTHSGFERVAIGEESNLDLHGYLHYLHHKYFECNYADGPIPLDKWFGTFHDGSSEAQEAMDRRFLQRARAAQARAGASPSGTGPSP
jgi:sterol desaturase/sphingolipid hydroxylase (fatty acid hydroxylase superfamily)